MTSNRLEKYPLNRRKNYVNRNFQLFDDMTKSSRKKHSTKIESKPIIHKPEFILSIHHKEGLHVENGLRPLMSLLKEFKGKEIYQSDPRTSLHIKGLDNIYYKTRKPLQTHDVCKRFKPGMPVWLYFKTTSEENFQSNENETIDYTLKERLHYGYRGRLQREQLKIKQQRKNPNSSSPDPLLNLTLVRKNAPLSTICHLVTLGSFLDCGTYIAHASTLSDIDKFELEFRAIPQSIYLRSIKNQDYLNTNDDLLYNKILYSISIPHDNIESYLIVNHQDDFIDLFIPLLYAIKPIQEIELDDLGTRKRTRATRFHRFDTKHIAESSVLHVRIPLLNTSSKMINDLATKLLENNIKILYGNIQIIYYPNDYINPYENLQFGNYLCNYAWHMLISLGYRLKDKLTDEFVSKLVDLSNDSSLFYHALRDLWKTCKDNRFLDIYVSLSNNAIKYADVGARWLFDCTTPNYCYVPRVIVTPTQLLPQPMRPMKENRVLRGGRFGSSFAFCRVLLRDEDLVTMSAETVEQCRERILDLIKQDLTIAQTDYEYLHCSNSQLRDRSFWFYKPNNGNTAETIRNWMGDFRHEYSVSSYVTRMALCFTGSIKTFTIQKATEIEEIPDIKTIDGRYVFTDGIGKISEPMMRRVFEALDLNQTSGYLPCALQIRMAGMKGVLVKAPELGMIEFNYSLRTSFFLGSREIIQVRRSQIKFECDHYDLEVIDYSKPCNLTLNRQVITLLSSLGVQDIAFLHIQNEARLRATMALLKCREAISLLDKVRFFEFEKISNSGSKIHLPKIYFLNKSISLVDISQEPFFRSLLIAAYRDRLRCLKQRSNVSIPKSYGRAMFGIIDESRTLQYGEVFIQHTSNSQLESEIVLGYVSVTKNPCLYPGKNHSKHSIEKMFYLGDIRVLKAIDVPHLHHLHDCVVFPCNGKNINFDF
jgi:RNA-dependent RNA polymerase